MKKILLTIIVVLLYSNATNAQWHNRSCGVIDINTCSNEEFECIWNKASKLARGGAITTVVGTPIIVAGGIIGLAGGSEEAVWTGVFFGMAGLFIDIVGAPVWSTGAVRKNNL